MSSVQKEKITVETVVNVSPQKAWKCWTTPDDITGWNFASDDWHSPWAKNDLRPGGSFSARMEAKDGSAGFDFSGTYKTVKPQELIEYALGDGREVSVRFTPQGAATKVTETFESEGTHSVQQQREGWQAILNNYKKYTESTK